MFRKVILLLLFFLFLSTIALSATVTLAWDPMPAGQAWTKVLIYEQIGVAPYTYTLVGQTPTVVPPTAPLTTTSFAATTGTHTYVARASNGQSESVNSNAVQGIILATPSSPTTITITITVP
jgi:hypothetical protein